MVQTAFQKLERISTEKNSFVGLGLDPTEDMNWLIEKCGSLEAGLKWLVDQMADYITMVKLNLAFYEKTVENRQILRNVFDYAHKKYGLLRCLDAKRGDIMATQMMWAEADIKNFDPDIVTINGYMGEDTVKPFLAIKPDLCIYVVGAPSNESSKGILNYAGCIVPPYINTILEGRRWDDERIGYVVGATKPWAARLISAYDLSTYGNCSPKLAPGFGAQGGDIESVSYSYGNTIYPISSGLTKQKYLQGKSPREVAKEWRDKINQQLAKYKVRSLKELLLEGMLENGLIKIAPSVDEDSWWTLKSGAKSPVYANIRDLPSHPELLKWATYLLYLEMKHYSFDRVSPVAYGALGLGSYLSLMTDTPPIIVRKERKEGHGIAGNIMGVYYEGEEAAVIEDVITSGESSIKIANNLREAGLEVNHTFLMVNREETQKTVFDEAGIEPHYLFTLREVVGMMKENNYELAPEGDKEVVNFISEHLEETNCWAVA